MAVRLKAPWLRPGLRVLAACFGVVAFFAAVAPIRVLAQNPDPQDPLLARTRASIEQFFEEFGYLRYQEDISQQKLKDDSKVQYKRDTIYDSILRMHYEDGKLRIDEQRLIEKLPTHVDARPLMLTNGFSSVAMIFHPYYEPSFRFTRIEDGALEAKSLARFRFEHVAGTPSPILYQMIGTERPLALSGIAWLDPSTGEIYKIEVEAGAGLSDTGVKAIRAALTYGPIPLRDEKQPQWLPISATVDLETPRQHWRNVHRFSDYRKYRVDVKMGGTETP
jgi:hypothetical protein